MSVTQPGEHPDIAASTQARVAGLFVHPLKSAAAIEVDVLALDDRGAVGDRRWLVVDPDGRQITARDTPHLCLVRPIMSAASHAGAVRTNVDGPLILHAPAMDPIALAIPESTKTREVSIWADMVPAIDTGDAAADWITAALNRPARIVRLAESAQRPLRAKFSGTLSVENRRVAFSDGAPLLILGQSSVDALNARLEAAGEQPVSASRFRPNVLLSHTLPHEEDAWRDISIGDVMIAVGEPCARCVMLTIDPLTARGGVEPVRTLASYRKQNGTVMFGMNATNAAADGKIRRGDIVRLASKAAT
jgi:uncharacterized protein